MWGEKILPMEPVPVREAFDSPEYIFQVKWDGVRCITHVRKDCVLAHNRKLMDRTKQYPELKELSEILQAEQAVFDGEIIVLRERKPSFPLVLRRDLTTDETTIRRLARKIPVNYMIFDLLYLDGRDMTVLPLRERLEILRKVINPGGTIWITDSFP
ncbi:DNA polymerase LigD, ligase domain protein, partial [Calderihabitans maritimus]